MVTGADLWDLVRGYRWFLSGGSCSVTVIYTDGSEETLYGRADDLPGAAFRAVLRRATCCRRN